MTNTTPTPTARRLERGDGPIGGVAAGLADYFDVDPTLIRLGLAAGTLIGGPVIPICYLAAWAIIPRTGEAPIASLASPATITTPPPPPSPPVPADPGAPTPSPFTEAPGSGTEDPADVEDADEDSDAAVEAAESDTEDDSETTDHDSDQVTS